MKENRGPGVARNAGLDAARNDRILFVDNDVILAPDCLDHLTRALNDHPAAVAAAPRVLYAQSRHVVQFDGANSHFLGLMALRNPDQRVEECDSRLTRTNSIVTACFLIDRRRWGESAPFDEDFTIEPVGSP